MKNFNSFMWLRGYGLKRVGRILACLTLLLTLVCGNAWGAETVLFSSFSNTTTSNYFKDYTVDGKTVSVATSGSISSSSGDYYCGAMGSTPSNNNGNYVELSVTGATIKTVSILITGNGSNKTCQPALLGWEGSIADNTTADYVLVPSSQEISDKGLSNAQWHQFDVHGNDLTRVRIYRAVKGVDVAGESTSKTTYGNAQTLQFYGIRVELESSSSTYTVTYNGNGKTSGSVPVDSDSPYEKDATVTVLGNSGTLAKTGFIFNGWNTSDDGAGTHYDADDTFTMGTANVTLYAEWAYPATGTGTVTYALSGSTTTGTVTGVSTINSLSSSFTTSTLSISSTKSGYTGDIVGTPSSFSSTAYLDVQFTIADGYQFNPSSITVQANPFNNTGALMAKVEILDGTTTVASNELSCSKNTDNTVTFASGAFTGKNFKGTTHLRIYFWGPASDKKFYVKSPLTITGTVAAAAAPCSDETGLAYGTGTVNKTYGDGSFTNTLTNSNSLSVTYSSSNTNVATVNESTGAVTIAGAGTTTITATWAGNATYCADEVSYTLNVKPAVGSVSGAWDRFGGETISLSVTPSGGSSYTYQWQKWYNSQWNNISNGADGTATISGATTSNLQISTCHKDNSGSYRCQVTAGGQTNETDGHQVKVYVLECYNSGTTVYNFTRDGNNQRGSLTIDLAASTNYGFKVHADNDYYGNNGTVYEDVTNWVCSTDQAGNLTIAGGLGGTFTITMDYSGSVGAAAEGIPEVSVTYPRKTVYLKPNSDWKSDGGKFAFYYYRKVGETTYGTGWTDFLSASVCDGDVYPATIPQWSGVKIIGVRFNSSEASPGWNGDGHVWNQTSDLVLTSNDLVEITGWSNSQNYNSTYDAPEYTISFAGNGNTGGSMTDVDDIACDASVTLGANAFVKTGYSFAGWKDASSNDYADEATINNIRANIALTAQWTEDKHSVTVAAGSNGTVSPSSVSNIGIATASGDITATANTGYHFTSWTLPSGTSAASTYSESSNPIRINATADGKTITANFSANTPTITLDDQDATNTPTGSVVATYGSSMPSIATLPTKTGYTFGGFYSDVAGGGTKYYNADGSSAKNSDLASATTLYALWTQSVTIDDNGGSADGSVSVTYNGTAGTPSVPTYSGHTVDLGYYAESGCTNKVMNLDGTLVASVTISTVPWTNSSSKWIHAGASTLYAHWKCNTPEISCSSNTITISVPSGATVYYTTTTDGSTPADPTSSSTAYNPSSKPTISADTKIKAIAIQSGCTNSAIASANLTYVAPGPSYTAPTSALDISAQTSVTAAALITAHNATQTHYLSTNTDTLLLIPSDIYYNIGDGKENTWATVNGSPGSTSADWSCPAGSVSFKGRKWWQSSGNISTLQVRSDRSLNVRVKGCKTVSVLNAANSSTQYFVMEAYEYDDGYKSSDPDVSASNTSTSVTETSLSLNSSKEYVVVLRGNTQHNNKVYEIKFIAPSSGFTVSIAANPAGYGTVSSSSVTSVASGTSLSTSTNTLSVGATDVTATATSASAEYTYAFSNWTKSDGTALPLTVTADLSVYANFTRTANNYTLTWNTNGGSDLAGDYTSGSTAYGASITAPTDPTKSNYTFDGWNTADDGSGSGKASTMPASDVTYYAAWKQTVTLKTGSQGSDGDKTPYIYWNGTALSDDAVHSAAGYTLQGYYTAGSGGTKVLNADGTFAGTAVTDYITGGKWSRTGAAPTLYAQWVAAEDCSTSDFVIKKGSDTQYQGCMESTSYDGTATSFTAGSATTVGNAKMTISSYSKGITRPGSGNTFSIVIEPVSGYYLKSICWAGKVENDETVSYYWDDNSGSATTITPQTTSGTGVTYNAPSNTTKFTASYVDDGDDSGGIWWRNVQVEVCAAGGTTYKVTYDGNDETSGSVPTDATNYSYGGTVTVKGNTGSLEKTNYTFAGWTTNDDGTGSNYVADNTFSITANTTLYAKWTQAVTFDANTANHGSTGGSATAVWNATGLTGITHATPASGYKLTGYYTAATSGTKVLNSDGSFAATAVDGYVTDGKWSRAGAAATLYAQYESAGALTWNLGVNTDATSLTTSSKTSAFTEISTSNMSNAALKNLTYSGDKKSNLTGKISTPSSYTSSDYVYVTFQVASGYKFTPSSVKVKAQPVTSAKSVKLVLEDENSHSINFTTASTISGGSTQTVEMTNGSSVYFEGTVTLKIYCYGATDKYRLGTPITIEGEVEETCGTMPSYTSMSYTTTSFLPSADASGSPITIVGGDNIDTYQWKYNTVNDRTSGTNCGTGTSLTPLTDASATTDGTRYYWCEMANDACGITIKSPAVAITVAAAKSDATVTWTDPASTPNYGGGGYTIKATVDQTGWDGDAADLTISAPAGINIYNVTPGTDGSSRKYVEVKFDVQTSFDRSTYASNIPFTVSAAATASYNAISDDHNVSYSACTGGSASEELMPVNADSVNSTVKGWRFAGTGKMWFGHGSSTPSTGSSNIKSLSNTMAEGNIDHYYNTGGSYFTFYTETAITGVRLYVYTSNSNVEVSNVYIANSQFSTGTPSSGSVTFDVVYNDDNEGLDKGDNVYSAWAEITFDSEVAAGKYGLIKLDNNVKIAGIGLISTSGGGATLNTHLQWSGSLADGATVNKYTTDAYFTYSASMITENTNSLGAITYSSSNTSVATVDATGKVALVAAGSTTIKATLAASGCYKKAEISYTLNVTEVPCAITAGTLTLTSGTESKCSSDNVTLTLTGFESGASIQWKDGDADINNGGNYTIATDGTTSTLTTNQEGTYSVMVTKDCSVRSNRITISNKSTEVGAKRIVKNWYIKNGRLTPDIELWTLQNGAHLSSVAWDPANATGLTASDFYESDGKVYLKGKEPSSNTSGADIDYTLTLTVVDDCEQETAMSAAGQLIYLHHQKNTDKHVLAFVVTGTEKGGFTEGITAAQTTSVELYNTIAANFDVLATNIYSTDDEQALKEYYSQFDILCVTDYPNTGTKGVNKKSYVDALGALVDIRPILTMEAFVAKLANWKAKGISGTPQSPTTRQYSMLLQCKDHEIFAGTELTKVGEGEDEMYRVSMVDNTLEDYVTLDATYGGGEHAEKSGYEYGSKPALQGFTFNATMEADGLLPLGLIDDGAGNDLQVGIERQAEMEARLMVLGINGYAMERLTDDGQTVVVNALKYLMKKNSEDIADCSNTFVGGAEGDETNWNNATNWSGNTVPDKTQKVRIVAPCVIPAEGKAHVAGVIIAPNGTYNHGSDNATGSLTISAGAALIVDGKVEAATAPYFTKTRATSSSNLAIGASSTAQGALIFDNEEGETNATVAMYSASHWETVAGKKKKYWSYVALPIQSGTVGEYFYNGFSYLYDETQGWVKKGMYTELHAFEGLGISMQSGNMEYFHGPLAPTTTQEFTLTKTPAAGNGENLIGNSWTAPIQIANFDASDFGEATATVYVYNTGRDEQASGSQGSSSYGGTGSETAGQWISVPISSAKEGGYTGLKVIPAMNAFQVNTSSETTLTLDYDKLVRGGATSAAVGDLTAPLRAPKRSPAKAQNGIEAMMCVRMSGEKTHADVWLQQDERFSNSFDNGWEATYVECDNRSPQFYAQSEIGKMAFLALPDLEGTVLGLAPSRDGNEYLFTFHYVGEEEFYLNDLKLHDAVLINEENSYEFTYSEGDTNRFYISRTAINAPTVTTGVGNTRDGVKAQKILYNNKLYIIVNGRVYSATGGVVR